jgi:hypothetical protein
MGTSSNASLSVCYVRRVVVFTGAGSRALASLEVVFVESNPLFTVSS